MRLERRGGQTMKKREEAPARSPAKHCRQDIGSSTDIRIPKCERRRAEDDWLASTHQSERSGFE
jgi:hypothetical protein